MRVIITGGSGLIGTALSRNLAADGHEVIVLSRTPQHKEVPDGVELVGWDAKTGDSWSKLITEDTAIVNLAGAGIADKRWSDERKQVILESRDNAGQAVVDAVSQAGVHPRVVVQSSAVGYYPSGDAVVTEETPGGDGYLAEVCRAWEASIAPLHENDAIRTVVIRTGVVLSLDGGAFPRQLMPFKFYIGGPVGTGEQWFPWVHIDDEIRAIRFLIENDDASGVYNLSAPNPVTNGVFTHHLARQLRRPGILPVPAAALQLLFGEMSVVLLKGQRVAPQRLQEAGFEFQFNEVKEALQDLLQ